MGSTSHLCVCTSPDVLNLSLVLFCITLITASRWNVSMFYSLSMIESRSCRPPWYMLLVLQRCRLHTQKKKEAMSVFSPRHGNTDQYRTCLSMITLFFSWTCEASQQLNSSAPSAAICFPNMYHAGPSISWVLDFISYQKLSLRDERYM